MIVGKTGVINAGSLTAVITTDDAYKKYSELSDKKLPLGLGQKEEEALATLQKMQQGEVPLNPAGVITVNGSINAGNRITLVASQIHLESAQSFPIWKRISKTSFILKKVRTSLLKVQYLTLW